MAAAQFNDTDIQKALVDKLFHYFIEEYDWMARVREQIGERVDIAFSKGVEKQISIAVEKITKDGFEREYSKTLEGFGSKSETTTISKELERLIGSYWTEQVNKDGKPSSSSYSSVTRAEYVFAKVAGDDFLKSFNQEIVNSAASIKDGFRDQMRAELDSVLGKVFHVKSATDRAEGRSK